MLNDPNLAQHIGFALEQVLVPEQNMGQSQSDSQESEMTMDTRGSSYASSVSGTYGSNPALMASFLRNILSVFFTASAIEVIEDPNVDNPAVPLIQNLTSDLDEGASQSTQDGLERIETVIIPNVERITEQVEEVIEHPPVFGEGNMNVVSAESSQNSEFSVNEAANVLMDMPDADSSRLGGRKRKSRAKKQKGGKRKKTMKKSKLRKHKTLKRRKSNKKRKTRKM